MSEVGGCRSEEREKLLFGVFGGGYDRKVGREDKLRGSTGDGRKNTLAVVQM